MAEKRPITHVLLMVDATDASLRAAEYRVRLCRHLGAKLTALAVVDTETLRSLLSSRIMVQAEMQDLEAELQSSAEKRLKNVAQLGSDHKVKIETVLMKGSTHGAFLEEVRRRRPDLIVMGGYTSSVVKRDLPARERQRVMDDTQVPILLVK